MTPDVDRAVAFLGVATPDAWIEQAADHLSELVIDHANCEKKAAGTALSLLYRYVDRPELLAWLSKLAREELRHFEQVCDVMNELDIRYTHLSASRYAGGLRAEIANDEPRRLVDVLLCGAIVEARSCERFLRLAGALPEPLAGFYSRLLDSEARHFEVYLDLAERYADEPLDARLGHLLTVDADLVTQPDTAFRFHSGPLATT